MPLPAEYGHTTGETIGLSLARVVPGGAASIEGVFNAQAAAQILGASGHRQRHPVRKAVHKASTNLSSTEWGVKSHQEEQAEQSAQGDPLADKDRKVLGNEPADEGAEKAARLSAEGRRASPTMGKDAEDGEYRKGGAPGRLVLQWRIHTPEHSREPRDLHPRIEEFPDEILTTVPLHLDMWHPTLQECGRCEKKGEATTRFRCLCFRRRWRESTYLQGGQWRVR